MDQHQQKCLEELEKKILWLATWTIHNANHIRPNEDGVKVGGHQASSASLATIMTALYFSILRPEDRVAVKPHASPIFHVIQYLFGNQTREKLEALLASLAEPKKLVLIAGADHFFAGRLQELRQAVELWVKEAVASEPSAEPAG